MSFFSLECRVRHVLSVALLCVGVFFFQAHTVSAFSLSPASAEIPSLLHNTTQSRTFTIRRDKNEVGDLRFHVLPQEASNVQKMITSGEEDIILKADQQSLDYTIRVSSGNVANGKYLRYVSFIQTGIATKESRGNFVSVVKGIVGTVEITVGGVENLQYKILDIFADPTEIGQDLSIHMRANNTGNVDWHPKKVVFQFTKTDGTLAGTQELTENDLPVFQAGYISTKDLIVPVHLDKGDYFFTAAFFDTDLLTKSVVKKSDAGFTVFPEGTLEQNGELLSVKTNKTTYGKGEKIRLEGEFQNIGSVALHAIPVVNVTRGDQVVDLIREKENVIPKDGKYFFTSLLSYPDPGDYSLEVYVDYGAKRTTSKIVKIKIVENILTATAGEHLISYLNKPVGLFVGVVIFLFLLFGVHRYRKNKQQKNQKIIKKHTPHVAHIKHKNKK